MRKNTYKIYTLGCKVNQYDSGSLSADLKVAGLSAVVKNADWAIINTCAVTKTAIRKGRQTINKARVENPKAKIILMGCWPKAYPELKKEIKADYVFSVREGDRILKIISKQNKSFKHASMLVNTGRKRYFVKIQDGCEQFCSYCIIPYTRGKLKSRPEKEILDEIKQAVDSGYQEIVLSGIHLGLYGKDLRINLVNLIKKILKINNLGRVRLSSIEIGEVTDDLIKLISQEKKICQHLHIPLQSGTDKILKLMNRPYDTKKFKSRIKKIRQAMPEIAITTDVIVGFPGETKNDFTRTFEFIKKINFNRLHVFSFSAHEKTPAAHLPNPVSALKITTRSEKLRKLSHELEAQYEDKFKNRELEVIIERRKADKYVGKTEYYFDVEFIKAQVLKGDTNIGQIITIYKK